MAYGYILVLLPPAYHGEDFAVADRNRNCGYRIFLDEEIGYIVVGDKALLLFRGIVHGKHGFSCKAALADQLVIGHFGKESCANFFGKLVKHVCASTGGVVNPVGNNTCKFDLVTDAFLLDSHAEPVGSEDTVEIVRCNDDGIIGIVQRSAETAANHVTEDIKKNNVIFIVEAEFLEQGDRFADNITAASASGWRTTSFKAVNSCKSGFDNILS